VLFDAMLAFARCAKSHRTDSSHDTDALVSGLAWSSRCPVHPLSDTVAQLGISSSTPAVRMKITAGQMVDVLEILTLGVDAARSAMGAPRLPLIRG
jgi:hypothetical protein